MKTIMILLSLLAAVSLASAYTPEQNATIEGVRLSFQLGQSYEKAVQGQDIPAFNALVEQWNAWVVRNFGEDATLLMKSMTVPSSLQKPYIAANNSTGGIVHEMDSTEKYTTNDMNQMSDYA
ncbi:MAG TPA: hypothetical protein PKK11_08970, partial [Methanothrix sp.]|nr:hypothetical protein [Methanothrix sp.]HPT19948.1 hypothetical protein [Methanothrix sp.]